MRRVLKMYDEPESPKEAVCLRYVMNPKRQMKGSVEDVWWIGPELVEGRWRTGIAKWGGMCKTSDGCWTGIAKRGDVCKTVRYMIHRSRQMLGRMKDVWWTGIAKWTGLFEIYDESVRNLLKIYGACLRYLMNRNREREGAFKIHDEPASPNAGGWRGGGRV